MANAQIFAKWSDLTDGGKNGGAWCALTNAEHTGGGGGVHEAVNHAERKAWRLSGIAALRTVIASRAGTSHGIPQGVGLQVKVWVDQQICPECQKWMLVEVQRHLGTLRKEKDIAIELFAEVRVADAHRPVALPPLVVQGNDVRIPVTRATVWPQCIGNQRTWGTIKTA